MKQKIWWILWGGPRAPRIINLSMAVAWMGAAAAVSIYMIAHGLHLLSIPFLMAGICGVRWGWHSLGERKTRRDFILELISVWDKTVQSHPELRKEYDVAHEWLTKTWTVEELSQFPK